MYEANLEWQYPIKQNTTASTTPPDGCIIPENNYNPYFECRCREWFKNAVKTKNTVIANDPYTGETPGIFVTLSFGND